MNGKDLHALIGKRVEVITVHGTFRGTLLSVGTDFLILRTRIRGRIVRLLIRLALIVALFRLIGGTGEPWVFTPSSLEESEEDVLTNFFIEENE
ncbi:hypothetical protein [Sporolactobacillus putidus]|uniref:DUF2642 domain-containing protein n=1 Tax=Sporolactobacillus putidus TaxID=492735 RepID=A0A917S3T0_9BACL|nr:hypothetical protein [Sporolactobacillus putidus]GGL54961.1 hypothetical protein GCM10007968_18800 [Sporolactobacillus putidus]